MTEKEQLKLVQEIIAEETDKNPSEIRPEMNFVKDLEMDNNSIQQVLIACEVEFGVEYSTEDYRDIQTVQHLLNSLKDDPDSYYLSDEDPKELGE